MPACQMSMLLGYVAQGKIVQVKIVIIVQVKINHVKIVEVIGLSCSRAGKEFQFSNFPLNIICQIEQKTFITF